MRSAALSIAFLAWTAAAPAQQAPVRVILDTDIGTDIDDAWALGLAMTSPEFELLAVTITDGDTAARARIACKLLYTVDRSSVPVAVGRPTLPPKGVDYQLTWAEEFTAKRPVSLPAAQLIVDTVRRFPNQVTLVAVGPLQNVADALRLEPRLPALVKRVVLMSGSIRGSAWNPAPVPEWNVVRAIADAQLVYAAGFPLTTVPLDSTSYVQLKDEERERLRARATPLTRSLEALYRLWLDGPSRRMTLHDQLAVAERPLRHAPPASGRSGVHAHRRGRRPAHDRLFRAEAGSVHAVLPRRTDQVAVSCYRPAAWQCTARPSARSSWRS